MKLPIQLLYEDDSYYGVRGKNSSPNWEALAFDLYQEKETVNMAEVTSDSETNSTDEMDAYSLMRILYSEQCKTQSGEGKINKQEYALLVNNLEKRFVKKKIKNYEKAITVEAKHKS